MIRRILLAAAAAGLAACAGPTSQQEALVGAAVSLRDVFQDLAGAYGDRTAAGPLRFEFASSGVLVQQALQGAPFDVVALAGEEEMVRLESAGVVVTGTVMWIATNRLSVVVPRGGTRPGRLEDLRLPAFRRVAVGSPATVPAGRYAAQALATCGIAAELEPRLLRAGHVRQVLALVERGEAEAGIVYRTDAPASTKVEVALEVDPALHDPIRYPVALLADAPNPEGGRRFLDLLRGPRGQVALRRHGFGAGR